jgi:hypothetical protein
MSVGSSAGEAGWEAGDVPAVGGVDGAAVWGCATGFRTASPAGEARTGEVSRTRDAKPARNRVEIQWVIQQLPFTEISVLIIKQKRIFCPAAGLFLGRTNKKKEEEKI